MLANEDKNVSVEFYKCGSFFKHFCWISRIYFKIFFQQECIKLIKSDNKDFTLLIFF